MNYTKDDIYRVIDRLVASADVAEEYMFEPEGHLETLDQMTALWSQVGEAIIELEAIVEE